MTIDAPQVAVVTRNAGAKEEHSYVDWPAIIAGLVLASAISLVLLTFGSAVGLSFADFSVNGYAPSNDAGDGGTSALWVAIAAGSWLLWVLVSSMMAGGYLTGRMRRRAGDATEHEVDVRDGAHGLLVWAGALVLGAVITTSGIGALAGAVGNVAGTATEAASNAAGDAASNLDPNALLVDTMFRPAQPTAAAQRDPAAVRTEAGRVIANGVLSDEFPAEDRTYLSGLVAANTGLTPAEADARVDQAIAKAQQARDTAAEAAEAARKATVIGAFIAAAALLVSAIGAYWAASMGGRHRDDGTVFADVFRRY